MKHLLLFFSIPRVRACRISPRSIMVLVAAMVMRLVGNVSAQNPSFAGQQFQRVWNGSGKQIYGYIDVFLTSAGVFINTQLNQKNGLFYADDSGEYTVATTDDAQISEAAAFRLMGRMTDGGLLFCPIANANIYPCQVYNGSGLNAVVSPTPEQSLNTANYFDGRFVYLEQLSLGGTKVWYYSEGNPPQLWYENTVPGILDYDGESLACVTGTFGAFEVQLRTSDGTLTPIIAQGDPMPGLTGETFDSDPIVPNTEVDQGSVYLLGVGTPTPLAQSLFSSSDGTNFNVIATTGQEVPGLTGVTISGMELEDVTDGKIWLYVGQSDGDHVLYQIVGNVWTRVAGKTDSYDGRAPVAFDVFPHSMIGDQVVVAVSFLDFSSPTFYATDLYVNGALSGFATGGGGVPMQIVRELNGDLTVSATGDPGVTNTLQASTSLTNTVWDTVGTVIADGSGLMQWTMSPTNNARFFRLVQ